jgi:hypothetical protein
VCGQDELEEKKVRAFGSGGAKNYVVVYEGNHKGSSTVKGIKRGKLNPEYQNEFLRAAVMQQALGLGDTDETRPHQVHYLHFERDRETQTVHTYDAVRSYRLVNDKVELFVDGSTLPLGHEDVEDKHVRLLAHDSKIYWQEKLDESLKRLQKQRDAQDTWEGKRPGEWRNQTRHKRRREGEGDELDEKHVDNKRARVERVSAQLYRQEVSRIRNDPDLDADGQEQAFLGLERRPDPALFDGLMDSE